MDINMDLQAAFERALSLAKSMHHEFVTPEHLLSAMLSDMEVQEILDYCDIPKDELEKRLHDYLTTKIPVVKKTEPLQSSGLQIIIRNAYAQAMSASKPELALGDVLVALFSEERLHASWLLRKLGLERLTLLRAVSALPRGDEPEEGWDEEPEAGARPDSSNARQQESALDRFTIDLTARARRGDLEPFIGRNDLLERTMQVLVRKRKNNPLHVGEPGVGKTAITEGLAQRIVAGTVPPLLANMTIVALDIGSLVAGTRYRGDFEERIKRLVKELAGRKDIIIFIDEIHTIVGAGAVSGGSLDASNLLKPMLSSGSIRCIGSTTWDDARKFFEKDRALARRFQQIDVPEPSTEETKGILSGLKHRYEEYHHICISDEVLEQIVDLANRHLTERWLPDKAIDLVDEIGAWVRMHHFRQDEERKEPYAVTVEDAQKVVSTMARIPQISLAGTERDRLRHLRQELSLRVFGQDAAVEKLSDAIKRSRAGFRKADKPVANLLFVGPTGVGKTELARSLAEVLAIPLLRFDMSEYQERHSVSRLAGSPPGYVGHEEGGQLTDAIRKSPHAVLLLDEIEKAHPDIFNMLLQIMDYATLTDSTGRKADFRNVILIMTSNAGARDLEKPMIGFGERLGGGALQAALQNTFTPEFRNRLDGVIEFAALPMEIVRAVAGKELKQFATLLSAKKVELRWDTAVEDLIAQKGYSREYGARNIARVVEEQIKPFFVDEVLFGRLEKGGVVTVSCKDDMPHFEIDPAGAAAV